MTWACIQFAFIAMFGVPMVQRTCLMLASYATVFTYGFWTAQSTLAATLHYGAVHFMLAPATFVLGMWGMERDKRIAFSHFEQKRQEQEQTLKEKNDALKYNSSLKIQLSAAQLMVDQVVKESEELLQPYKIEFKELKFEVQIGQGAFGVVWRGDFRGSIVAIKTVRPTKVTKNTITDFLGELKTMAPLTHPNLVNCIGGCWADGPDKLCLVLEYCAGGALDGLLDNEMAGTWESPRYGIALGIAACFKYREFVHASICGSCHRL